jgi:excisionase family DNA binding protein
LRRHKVRFRVVPRIKTGSGEMNDKPNDKPYGIKEAADRADVDIKTMYEAVHLGQVPAFRVGKIFKIPRPAFDALLREGKFGGEAA